MTSTDSDQQQYHRGPHGFGPHTGFGAGFPGPHAFGPFGYKGARGFGPFGPHAGFGPGPFGPGPFDSGATPFGPGAAAFGHGAAFGPFGGARPKKADIKLFKKVRKIMITLSKYRGKATAEQRAEAMTKLDETIAELKRILNPTAGD